LEWCTHQENCRHACDNGRVVTEKHMESLRRNGKKMCSVRHEANKKKVINIETGIYYDSLKEAAASLNMSNKDLSRKLLGDRKNNTPMRYV